MEVKYNIQHYPSGKINWGQINIVELLKYARFNIMQIYYLDNNPTFIPVQYLTS